jgi:PAS domain S-box-containing protein
MTANGGRSIIRRSGGTMGDGEKAKMAAGTRDRERAGRGVFSALWPGMAAGALLLALAALAVRLHAGARFDAPLLLAAVVAAAVLALRPRILSTSHLRPPASNSHNLPKNPLESADSPALAFDLDGRLSYANPSADRLLGYEPGKTLGLNAVDRILAPGEGARLLAELKERTDRQTPASAAPSDTLALCAQCLGEMANGELGGIDLHLRRKDQLLHTLPVQLSVLRNAAGTVSGLMALGLGRSPCEQQDRELRESQELYRLQEAILDSVADGICGVDRNGLVSFANPAAAVLLGSSAANLTGKPVHELLHGKAPRSRPCEDDCQLRRAVKSPIATTGEDTVFRADGSSFPGEYFLTPILDRSHFSGSVLSFRDISHRYALDRLKDEFISTVSHELRTPLTSIRGALGLLSSGILGQVSDKAGNLLRIALTNSDRLVRLINDILDLERIQSGREPLAFRPVQLAETVRQAIDDMQPVAEAAGVQLIHDATKVEVAADPDRLLQVLTNLLSNAVKFSPANSTVSVMLRPGADGVTVSVIDQGRGIPAEKLEAVFGRFQQVDASDSRQKGGSGLGLAICRTIVLQHSGRIWAERNPICGTTFRVFLPYQPPSSAAQPAASPLVAGQGTVLLADAHGTTRPLIALHLGSHGYRVVETSTVDQTLAAAREGVQAILVDTSLDGMNGWEILPLLRSLDPDGNTPVVLLSLDNRPDQLRVPGNAEGWVTNPIEEDALLAELARVLCGPGEKARILIVEDDVDLANIIGNVFSRESIEVEVAFTRQAALDACFAFKPHLMVLDIGLPDGDGFSVVDWLRQHQSLASLPLVVYSARELSAAERRQLTLGPTHFLTKARVQPQQLEALVLTMLRSSRRPGSALPPEKPEAIS